MFNFVFGRVGKSGSYLCKSVLLSLLEDWNAEMLFGSVSIVLLLTYIKTEIQPRKHKTNGVVLEDCNHVMSIKQTQTMHHYPYDTNRPYCMVILWYKQTNIELSANKYCIL